MDWGESALRAGGGVCCALTRVDPPAGAGGIARRIFVLIEDKLKLTPYSLLVITVQCALSP